jgi:hypothetical protein
MMGFTHQSLQKFAKFKLGACAWDSLVEGHPLPEEYEPQERYPNEEVGLIVQALAARVHQPTASILDELGEFLAPDFVAMAKRMGVVPAEWRTLDLLEHVESHIHTQVRREMPDAAPPALIIKRPALNEARIFYSSPYKLCPMTIGLIRGIARYYGEAAAVTQPACMYQGDPHCELHVRL